jgi:flagellar biosynthesis GTPase FlhF
VQFSLNEVSVIFYADKKASITDIAGDLVGSGAYYAYTQEMRKKDIAAPLFPPFDEAFKTLRDLLTQLNTVVDSSTKQQEAEIEKFTSEINEKKRIEKEKKKEEERKKLEVKKQAEELKKKEKEKKQREAEEKKKKEKEIKDTKKKEEELQKEKKKEEERKKAEEKEARRKLIEEQKKQAALLEAELKINQVMTDCIPIQICY